MFTGVYVWNTWGPIYGIACLKIWRLGHQRLGWRLGSEGRADGGLAFYKTCGITALLDQTEVYGAVFVLSDQAVGGAAHHKQNSKKVQMEGDTL